jgi:glycosyltransferase involved in cell wall biosynthesis
VKKISVIVPIYNVERYLEKCLESIINQTFINLEIILINDGSTDFSGSICEKYKNKDNRIILIHKKNEGLSAARNKGLSIATGDYISFVDSDDFLDLNMYEILYKNIEKENADIVSCNYYKYYSDKKYDKNIVFKKKIIYKKKEIFGKDLFNNYQMDIDVWNKLYKKEIFKDIKFPYKKVCESTYIMMSIFNKANCIVVIPDCLYFYRKREKSIMNLIELKNEINMDLIEGRIIMAIDYNNYYNLKEGIELLFHVYKTSFDMIVLSSKRKKFMIYEKILCDLLNELLKKNISWKIKLGIWKRCFNINVYRFIKLRMKKG